MLHRCRLPATKAAGAAGAAPVASAAPAAGAPPSEPAGRRVPLRRRTFCAALLPLATALCLTGVLAPAARAQAVAGRVVDADGGAPLGGAFLVLTDSAGRRRAAVLADGDGRFVLTAPTPGSYRLRAERIGMGSRVVGPFRLGVGERRSLVVTLAADAIPLAAIEVAARRRCELRPQEGELSARVWEEVRKALRVSSWSRGEGGIEYVLRRHERVLDLPWRTVRYDSVRESVGSSARPFVSPPAEELAKRGYVRQDDSGGFVYYAPDEEVLASESFLDSHCLQLRPRMPGDTAPLAIEFRRVHGSGPVDIEGTAYVSARTGELRKIEFDYVGLSFPAPEAGGRVEYRRLPGGVWIIERWQLTFPLLKRMRAVSFRGNIEMSRLGDVVAYAVHETTGEVVSLRSRGKAEVDAAQAASTGTLAGEVYDSTSSRPVPGARVYLSGTVYSAVADDSGRFRIRAVPPGRYSVAFAAPLLDSLLVLPPALPVVLEAGKEATIHLAVASLATMRGAACPAGQRRAETGVLFGRVTGAAEDTRVEATWTESPAAAARTEAREAGVDAGGHFVLCGVPAGVPVTLRAAQRELGGTMSRGAPTRATVPAGGVLRVDLSPAGS